MTISPATTSSSRFALRNGGNNTPTSKTFTVTFTNTATTPAFTAVESGGGNHLTITKTATTITITVKNGSGNRGNFAVVVTPTNCGAAQTIYVSVAQ
jgi:hypothetical protein